MRNGFFSIAAISERMFRACKTQSKTRAGDLSHHTRNLNFERLAVMTLLFRVRFG
jgi:hypothetical protein